MADLLGPGSQYSRRQFIHMTGFGVAGVAGVGLLAACSGTDDGATTAVPLGKLEELRERGSVTVGFGNDPPWSFTDAEGNLIGFSPGLIEETFKGLGVPRLEPVLTDFGSLIPGLMAGRFDAVAELMYVRYERCEQVVFADPIMCVHDAIATAEGNPLGIETLADIATNHDVRIGVVTGEAEATYVEEAGGSTDQISFFVDLITAVEALEAGRVDAVITSIVALTYLVNELGSNVHLTEGFIPVFEGKPVLGCAAFAFPPGDEELRDAFNIEQAKLIESGEAVRIIEPYAGDLSADVAEAQKHSVEELCAP